jgi:hypothetical protein
MPVLLTHLTAVERLAAHVNALPPDFARALGKDLEYGRFGAVLPELPWFGGWKLGLSVWVPWGEVPRFTTLFRDRAPVGFGLKAAELVANGALVGSDAGLAVLAGYFTQLHVTRALEPLMRSLLATHRKPGEAVLAARHRIEWTWAMLLMQELHGSTLVGTKALRDKLQIRKGGGPRRIGRGLYELVRVASQEAFGEAPTKHQVDSWTRGLYLFSLAASSPLGKLKALRTPDRDLYRSPGIDVFGAVEHGLAGTRETLHVLGGMIRRNSFSARSRLKLMESCPEGSLDDVTRAAAA